MSDRHGETPATKVVSAIEAMQALRAPDIRRSGSMVRRAALIAALALTFAMVFVFATEAFAGQSATGELAFSPCTDCHPVTLGADGKPTKPLPIDMEKHEIVLEKHDILGEGDKACLACHDDPSRNPGKLLLPDGSFVDVTGDVSRVCQRCHFEKYQDFIVGVHGKNAEKCTSAGCHDAHTPSYIYVPALPPFQGTGIEVKAVGEHEPFKPLAPPAVMPPVETPVWLMALTGLGVIVSASAIGYLIMGRPNR